MQPGRADSLNQTELQTVRWTLKQFALALKAADRGTEPRSLGSYLREAWAKVLLHAESAETDRERETRWRSWWAS